VVIVHDVTRIRQAERAKTDFVATVSHELRTPITPIKGHVEILQARGPNLSEDKRQDMLRIVAERADHLARLVEVLANLISNAHKYSPADQEVRLRVWRDNGWAMAAVADRAAASPARSWTGCARSSTGSRTR
jgi:signal transduction histidine kinase